jgi:hypothetical protein
MEHKAFGTIHVMDFIQAFSDAGYNVNIQGTLEDPLFRASDIP